MNAQIGMFHDTPRDALGADILAIGSGSVKKAAGLLWPSANLDTAYARLRACLSPENRQELDLDELLRIKQLAAERGSFALVGYENNALGIKWEKLSPADAKKQQRKARRRALLEELKRLEDDE